MTKPTPNIRRGIVESSDSEQDSASNQATAAASRMRTSGLNVGTVPSSSSSEDETSLTTTSLPKANSRVLNAVNSKKTSRSEPAGRSQLSD